MSLAQRIFASVESSLERLQLDYIDVLQCHRFDKSCPIEETMQALHDVVQSGKVRYIGMSSSWAWQLQLMQSELSGLFASGQRLKPAGLSLRHSQSPHPVHFNAESLQCTVP